LERKYNIPDEYWNFNGENVISVWVFNAELSGGILRGKIGIYELDYQIAVEISLEGMWKFLPGIRRYRYPGELSKMERKTEKEKGFFRINLETCIKYRQNF
jgi:hypothetical protein